ncbi:MAG: T9SS type A sorting domain-containing protein [Bacteroidales bacterium]|nr:T9SS type A sorting domain-containing protein [Bacteroidales bacterium]
MKKLYVLLIALLFAIPFNAYSQLPDNSLAPDFVATDINGVEHHLQDYLNAGKTVIIDFFTVWCSPCWGYHEEGILEEAWSLYGPDGTDQLMIFQIEIEPTMGVDEMSGNGPDTQGDWLEGVEYPTIDDLIDSTNTSPMLFGTVIGDAYNVEGVPNIVVICPSRLITNDYYPYMTAQDLNEFAINCPLATEPIDASIFQYVGDLLYCDYELKEPKILIQNLSLSGNLTAANIQTIVNGAVVAEYAYSGNLPLYDAEIVTLAPVSNLGDSAVITFKIVLEGDTYLDNNERSVEVHRGDNIPVSNVIVEVKSDDYPEDFSFTMEDGDGNIIFECESIPNNSIQTFEIALPEQTCVVWTIFDSYGDGMYDGYVKLIDAASNEELFFIDGNNYFDIHQEIFNNIDFTGITEQNDVNVKIYPNPTADWLQISVSDVIQSLEVVNVLGQQMMNVPMSTNKDVQISLKSLPAGIYFLNLKGDNFIKTERVVKK